MAKEDIFSKIQIKDYNNTLENVLEQKDFSEDTKNLLLSMFYKIENGYKDYKTVKINTSSKSCFLKQIIKIIKEECNEIELVRPMSEQSKELEKNNLNYIVDKQQGKIKVYQNEKMMLEALITLEQKEIILDEKYTFFEISVREIIETGNKISQSEIIRDFNGWSWDITPSQIENKNINIVYQNLLMILGNPFLQKWITNIEEVEQEENIEIPNNEILRSKYNDNFGMTKQEMIEENKTDYIKILQDILTEKCGEENTKKLLKQSLKTILVISSNINNKQKEIIINRQKDIEAKLEKMNNNINYLEEISENKKSITMKIRKIDTLLNNDKLLKEEYEQRNSKLSNKEKIFSVSHLAIMLEKERNEYLEQIKKLNKMMEPKEFVANKQNLEEKSEFFKAINIEQNKRTEENEQIELLQKEFLNCIEKIIDKAETKKEITDLLYQIRYYKNIPYKSENLGNIKSIQEKINILEEKIIQKACKENILNKLSEDRTLNYNILKNLYKSKIINLENTIYILRYNKGILKIEIYDTNIEEEIIELEIKEKVELIVKLNKKIKVFN